MIFSNDSPVSSGKDRQPPPIEGLAGPDYIVFQAFCDVLQPPEPIDFVAWAEKNVVFDAGNRFPGPYDSAKFPYYRKILRCLQPDHPASTVVLMGSAQTGKTITANVFAGATLENQPGGFMYVMPTIEMAGTWVREKWQPFVDSNVSLKRLFPREKKSRDKTNKLLFKERADGFSRIRITGANSAASLSSASYRNQVQDELGKWEENEYGDPEHQANMRSKSYGPWAKIFKISTPGIKGICRITKNWERSNQQKYHVPCPHCGHRHALEWENFKQSLSEGMDYSTAHFTCPDCGGVIEHHHKFGMLKATLDYDAWVADNPSSDIEGFYIWTAYSPLEDWAYIARHYFESLGDPAQEMTFMTETIGLPYEQQGEAPPWEELFKRATTNSEGTPQGIIPPGALLLTIGIDCQSDRVEWLLKGWGPDLRRYTIQHDVIQGHISEESTWKALDILANREWRNTFGQSFRADMIAIDANWETNTVKDWAKRFPENRVITIKGAREYTAIPLKLIKEERNNRGKIKNRQRRHWLVGVSGLKGALYKHLEKTDPLARGYCGFAVDLETEYFKQLCSERRVTTVNKKTGATSMGWVRTSDTRNEVLDMENYAEAAARVLGWHNLDDRIWEQLRAERESPAPDLQLDMLDPTFLIKTASTQSLSSPDPHKPTSLASRLA